MSDWGYIVGGLFGIAMFMIILGNMGAADDIYGDDFVVIDSNSMPQDEIPSDYDFDVDRIRFTPEFGEVELSSRGFDNQDIINQSEVTTDNESRLIWTGNTNDRGDDEGYVVLNSSERTDTVYIRFFDSGGIINPTQVGFFVEDSSGQIQELTGGSPRRIDLSGDSYDNLGNIENVEIRITGDSWVDLSGFENSDPRPTGGVLSLLYQLLVQFFSSFAELGKMVVGYLAFAAALPGLLGTFVRIYLGIFFVVFVLKEIIP